jgi:glycosyltransferase involved in cell wall biosynthesis
LVAVVIGAKIGKPKYEAVSNSAAFDGFSGVHHPPTPMGVADLKQSPSRIGQSRVRDGVVDNGEGVDERPTRVLVIGINYAPEQTGSAPYTAGLAEMIADFADVEVMAGAPHYPSWRVDPEYRWRLRRNEQRNGVDVRHFRHFVPRRQSAFGRAVWDGSFVANVASSRPRRAPDVVIASTPSLGGAVLGARFAQRYRVPFGVVIQDLVGQAARQSGISGGAAVADAVARAEGWTLRRADAVAVVSDAFREQLAHYQVEEARVRLLPNWTHVPHPRETRTSVRADLGWHDDEFVALHAGNMGLKQDLGNVIEAARTLEGHSRIRFVLCGDGNQRQVLCDHAAGLGNVSFLDPVSSDRYPDLLRAADVLLVNERASLRDMALPSKLTSYFAARRPVIAAVSVDGACAQEIARTDGAAHIVGPGQPTELAQAIQALSSDAAWSASMAAAGARFADAHLSRATAARRVRELVSDLLTGGTKH